MASNRAVKSRNRDETRVRASPQGAVRGGHQHVADVPRSRAPGRRGHHRRDRRRGALGVHLRRGGDDRRVPRARRGRRAEHGRLQRGHAARDELVVLVVAIDGPAGAGKSTIARALAERLRMAHLDTGAHVPRRHAGRAARRARRRRAGGRRPRRADDARRRCAGGARRRGRHRGDPHAGGQRRGQRGRGEQRGARASCATASGRGRPSTAAG